MVIITCMILIVMMILDKVVVFISFLLIPQGEGLESPWKTGPSGPKPPAIAMSCHPIDIVTTHLIVKWSQGYQKHPSFLTRTRVMMTVSQLFPAVTATTATPCEVHHCQLSPEILPWLGILWAGNPRGGLYLFDHRTLQRVEVTSTRNLHEGAQ